MVVTKETKRPPNSRKNRKRVTNYSRGQAINFKFFTCAAPDCYCVTNNKVERVIWDVRVQKRICKRHAAMGVW